MATQWFIPEGWDSCHPDELQVDGDNPNNMKKSELDALLLNLQKDGWLMPIVADMNMVIADGEQRWNIAKEHNQNRVPVLRKQYSDADRRIMRQVLNKLRGRHDPLKDALEYRRIVAAGAQSELVKRLLLSENELRKALEDRGPEEEPQLPALESVETDIELGDLYQLGDHLLLCGDSTKQETFEALMDETKADCVMTDPPYNVDYASKNEFLNKYDKGNHIQTAIINDDIIDYTAFLHDWLEAMKNHLTDYNSIYITISGKTIKELLIALDLNNYYLSQVLVWNKNCTVIGRMDYKGKHELIVYCWLGKHKFYGKRERTVWDIPKPAQSKLHPTMKPIDLCTRAITNSTMPGMTVLDPFGGSGSTLIACEQTNRKCRMIEIDPRYCQIIIDRWQAYSGQKANRHTPSNKGASNGT